MLHMKHWAKGLFVGLWKDGLMAELQARMSRRCWFWLFLHHNYQVSIGAPLFNGDGWTNTSLIQSDPLYLWNCIIFLNNTCTNPHLVPSYTVHHSQKNVVPLNCCPSLRPPHQDAWQETPSLSLQLKLVLQGYLLNMTREWGKKWLFGGNCRIIWRIGVCMLPLSLHSSKKKKLLVWRERVETRRTLISAKRTTLAKKSSSPFF